jgi:hypothetical protein
MKRLILVISIVSAVWACDRQSSSSIPSAPSPSPRPAPPPTPPGVFPPGVLSAYTLSGVVFEVTRTGQTPIEGVGVYCELCGRATHSWTFTDSNGIYSFTGVWTTSGVRTPVWFSKEGYADPSGVPLSFNKSGWRQIMVDGDTRFDVQLVRR